MGDGQADSPTTARFRAEAPDVFGPCRGTWGKRGATHVHLELAEKPLLTVAIAAAFDNLAARPQRKGF